jgi:uncharacterized phosphosugar-binding protein
MTINETLSIEKAIHQRKKREKIRRPTSVQSSRQQPKPHSPGTSPIYKADVVQHHI